MKLHDVSHRSLIAYGLNGLLRDVMAGLVGSIVLMTNIVSFAALMFPGALAAGASTAVWAMLVGSGFCGLWIAWRTSVPPLAVGMDSPTGAALVLLAAGSASAVLAAGGSPHAAVLSAMLLTVRKRVKSPLAIPLTLLAMTACTSLALHQLGLDDPAQGWYLPSLGALVPWHPVAALREAPMSLSMALGFAPDLVAVAIVALVSLVTKTSSMEVARKTSGDIDRELCAHGAATLAVVPLGGLAGSIQLGTSRLLEQAGGVTAADASAPASLSKLRDFCAKQGVTLGVSATAPALHEDLKRDGFFSGNSPPVHFDELNLALASAEDRVLAQAGIDPGAQGDPAGFEPWLQQQLGPTVQAADFMAYLEQRSVDGGAVLCRQGEPSDSIYLVAAGRLTIDLEKLPGRPVRLRSISTHTVVGEMGFIRRVARSATVSSEGPATVFTLTRERFGQMRAERPELASAFYEFLLSTLADRMGLSERMVSALSR